MDTRFLIAQILGLGALIISIISIPQKTKNRYIFYYIIQNILSGTQYILLGKIVAFWLCGICIVRLIVYRYRGFYNKFWNIFVLIFFMCISVTASILTFESIWDILPSLASIVVCYTVWQERIFVIRLGCIFSKVMWGIYALISLAYFSLAMDIVMIIWTIFVILRDFRKCKENFEVK